MSLLVSTLGTRASKFSFYHFLALVPRVACFLLCFPKKQKIRELRYLLDPMISPFRTHGGPVDTPTWTDNSIL